MRLIASIVLASSLCVSAQIQPNVMQELLAASVISASAVWAPTNAYAWYRPTSLSGIDNSPVMQWSDSSGNSRHLYVYGQSATYAPLLSNNIVNGYPSAWWTNSATQLRALTNNLGGTLSQPVTYFIVTKMKNRASSVAGWIFSGTSINFNQSFVISGFGSNPLFISAGTSLSTGRVNPFNWLLVTGCFNTTSSYLRTNGVLAIAGDAGAKAIQQFNVGSSFSFDGAACPEGGIAEIVVIAGAMSTNDLQWVENNLKSKYGL